MLEKWYERLRLALGCKPRCRLCKRKLEESEENFCRRCVKALIHFRVMLITHDLTDYLDKLPGEIDEQPQEPGKHEDH